MTGQETWARTARAAVGGLVAVAVPDESRVIVATHAGVGVFDPVTGLLTLRIRDNDYAWQGSGSTTIALRYEDGGVEVVPCMGLEGGLLPAATTDGWTWNRTPEGADLIRGSERIEVTDEEEFRAGGFSPEGTVFVYGTSPNLTILKRTPD